MSDPAYADYERLGKLLNCTDDHLNRAAAEIERMRAALREIVTTDPPSASDDWFQEWKNLAFRLKGIARRALEEQK